MPAACGVPNGFGGFNRSLNVPNTNDTLDVVCFSSCSACIGSGILELNLSGLNFSIVPSVSYSDVTVLYTNLENAQLTLTVLSHDGRMIQNHHLSSVSEKGRFVISTSEMKSGIYCITNLVNGKLYIGSAVHFKKRWSRHKSALQLNKLLL